MFTVFTRKMIQDYTPELAKEILKGGIDAGIKYCESIFDNIDFPFRNIMQMEEATSIRIVDHLMNDTIRQIKFDDVNKMRYEQLMTIRKYLINKLCDSKTEHDPCYRFDYVLDQLKDNLEDFKDYDLIIDDTKPRKYRKSDSVIRNRLGLSVLEIYIDILDKEITINTIRGLRRI